MNTAMRGIISATFLLVTSVVYAGHPAAGVQVLVNRGGATVFKGITDTTGQFTTDTLEPGEYQVEVRGPKVVPPVRYFLILSGARPMGQTITNAAGDLGLEAQVRRPVSIRGQVSSSRIIVLNNPVPPANPSPSSATRVRVPSAQPVATMAPTRAPTVASTASASGPSGVRPIASSSTPPSSWGSAPASPNPAMTAMRSNPATQSSPLRTPAAATVSIIGAQPSRTIDGKRYIWLPSAPGSKLGRWVLAAPATAAGGSSGAIGAAHTQTNAGSGR
ncbi:MAG: hypothetical protein ABR526_07885 [Chthoniobacterales bacterium]